MTKSDLLPPTDAKLEWPTLPPGPCEHKRLAKTGITIESFARFDERFGYPGFEVREFATYLCMDCPLSFRVPHGVLLS